LIAIPNANCQDELMKLDKKYFEFISFAENDLRVKEEAKKIPFTKKIEWTTRLREYAYGKKATTGRLRRIHSVAKLEKS
jgi:hypothetical protein